MFDENKPADENFEEFRVTNEKMISNLIACAKSVSAESLNKLEAGDIDEVLNIDNDAPIVHSLSDGEIAKMVLNKDKHEDSSDDDDIINTGEKIPMDDITKMCDQLISGMEQRAFINEREIMAVYSIKERLLRLKPMLIRQMALEEVFKKAVSRSAAELENPVPGPSSDVRLQHNMTVTMTTMTTLTYPLVQHPQARCNVPLLNVCA
jgi:hypothetical protein